MKNIMTSSMYLPTAAALLAAALAGPALADELVPLHGTLQAQELITPGTAPETISADGSGAGNATQLGQFKVTWKFTVNLADGTGSGPVHFTAANGDEIFTTATGSSVPIKPGYFQIKETHIITGGTGRFANAQGSFMVVRVLNFDAGLSSGSFQGIITSTGSGK